MTLPYGIGSRTPLTTAERAYLGARAALAMLPASPGEIADALRERAVRGAHGHHARGPLAMYLQGRTQFVWVVGDDHAICYLGHDVIDVRLEGAVHQFVRGWNEGHYADLDGEPSPGTTGPVSVEMMHDAWRNAR